MRGMKRILVLLLSAALAFGFFACGGAGSGERDPDAAGVGAETGEASGPGQTADRNRNRAEVDYGRDAFDLMGIEYQSFLAGLNDSMVFEFLDGESAGVHEAAYHYNLNDGSEVDISADGYVISVRTFYDEGTKYPAPMAKGIGGEDTYEEAVRVLGKPYYEGPETMGEEEKEYYTAVFYAGNGRYLKVYFNDETKYISSISCFYGEPPVYEEINGIKVGDSLDKLKAAYDKLYYATAYYDPSQGGPRYNRIYYTPIEDRDREVECLEFHVYDRKVVSITTEVYDILDRRDYEDVFGMKDVFKENNMLGHSGSIVYFYNDADGNEQVLLQAENCSTEEIDVDDDGITEIIAYKAGPVKAVDIYDYNPNAQTVLHLDVCKELGADWSEYIGNAANVKPVYAKCIQAGFYEEGAADRVGLYSVKDNILTYIGPFGPNMLQ